MNDQTPMPFGKYKGNMMEHVPASYLLWLWDEGIYKQEDKEIHKYIKDNLQALQKEAPDYILQHIA